MIAPTPLAPPGPSWTLAPPRQKGLPPPSFTVSVSFPLSAPQPPLPVTTTMSWRAASGVHMERALLEHCPNTLLRRRAGEALKSPMIVSDLALPKRGLRPIATSSTASAKKLANPTYTSLAEIIPAPDSPMVESLEPPRTPMRNCLVEKAARAYLLQADSSPKRNTESNTPWTRSFSRFLPRLSVFTMALNPFNAFNSAFQVFRFYLTGAKALQPQIRATVSRSVSRSISMPIERTRTIL